MDMEISKKEALTMHVDLNSCFAIIEQQANPLIRNKPVVIAAYDTPRGMIIASSYEAKALGLALGLSVADARKIYPGVIVMMPDPEKYFDANRRFSKVLNKYTNNVVAKSVDEFAIDFEGSPAIRAGMTMEEIGMKIKEDVKKELGSYVTINVGIAPNRFLAKLAAGLNKPDGMDRIDHANLREILSGLSLIDLPGINYRYQARLNLNAIYTPLQFLDSDLDKLKKQVFGGIVGYYWYLRLRGYPIDQIDFGRKTIGQQYALGQRTMDINEISKLVMKLSEKVGRRLRSANLTAGGIYITLGFEGYKFFGHRQKTKERIFATQQIHFSAMKVIRLIDISSKVTNISVTVYDLKDLKYRQISLFNSFEADLYSIADASDEVNDRYGEFTLTPALMANMQDVIIKRVAFGKIE
ncbi:hypothetical protein EBR37_02750 [bacterium]|nr:hypothetical protein [bacterium]